VSAFGAPSTGGFVRSAVGAAAVGVGAGAAAVVDGGLPLCEHAAAMSHAAELARAAALRVTG